MKRLTKAAAPLIGNVALVFLCATSAFAQISQIDRTKLPQNKQVQQAYTDLLPIDQYARTTTTNWRFPVPKEQVAESFQAAMNTLERQQEIAPDNRELQIFAGLVAHLAYNLEIEEGDGLALDLLEARANDDLRASWFLGIHQCQSNAPIAGMQRLLQIETSNTPVPRAFWEDYATCATITNMPIHAVRAYDKAQKDTNGPPVDEKLEQIARRKIKPSDLSTTYPSRQAWYQEKTPGHIRVTSTLCGESFSIRQTFHLNIHDVAYGTCLISIDTDQYPSRYGPSSASMLIGTQVAKPTETLDAFAHRILAGFSQGMVKDPSHANQTPLTGVQCPVATCLTFEVISDNLYKTEGGAHLLAVFFQSDMPAIPGLLFETPQQIPKVPNFQLQPGLFRPEDVIQRFDGTLYTFVTLDANQDIYTRSRTDFADLLKSFVVDTK